MALLDIQQMQRQVAGFGSLPAVRQMGLLIGLAASVALGVALVLWAQKPSYGLLYGGLAAADAAEVTAALDRAGIPYQLEQGSSAVVVPAAKIPEARLKLATEGLPRDSVAGLEFLDQDQPFGTSSMIETARYHRALAGELSRSIATLESVASARVHLAIPKTSVFIRDQVKPTASVLLNLRAGRVLDDAQIAGIVHLVASSIPGLATEDVTVVDQKGKLLTKGAQGVGAALSSEQFEHNRRVEEAYAERIVDILAPVVGDEGVRAEVTAELDFTTVEATTEDYGSEIPALRSEQSDENRTVNGAPLGIPGALSNEPPPAGTVVAGQPGVATTQESPVSSSRSSTRNFEVDRTISHTTQAAGTVKRLSVAVVIDDREQAGADGKAQRVARAPEEMDYLTRLVRDAIGFDAERGDSVNVINLSFRTPQIEVEPLAPDPIWKHPLMWDGLRYLLGATGVLFLIFGVMRPVLRTLAVRGETVAKQAALPAPQQLQTQQGQFALPEDRLQLTAQPSNAANMERHLTHARQAAQQDPKRVAQVVKTWLATEGG
jgi:flagellar M-ring protein FliF